MGYWTGPGDPRYNLSLPQGCSWSLARQKFHHSDIKNA
jgi:hypothetical protein